MAQSLPPLTPELWALVRDAFSEIADLAPADRLAALDRLELLGPAVALHVRAMFRAAETASALDRGIDAVVDQLMSPDSAGILRQH